MRGACTILVKQVRRAMLCRSVDAAGLGQGRDAGAGGGAPCRAAAAASRLSALSPNLARLPPSRPPAPPCPLPQVAKQEQPGSKYLVLKD